MNNNFTPPEKQNKNSINPEPTKETKKQIEIIPVPEMSANPEIQSFKFIRETNPRLKDEQLKKLSVYKMQIQNVDLANLSNWAKEQMKNYHLPENFLENLQLEQTYRTNEISVLSLRTVALPSHSPLVKRFLYLLPVYDSVSGEIIKIFVTIQGYAEE